MKSFTDYRKILFQACLFLTIALLCIDLYAPSLPIIAQQLHLSQSVARSLTALFFIGLGLSLPLYGYFADRYGRKPMILLALSLIGLGNLLSAIATSGLQLFVWRFLVGCGAAGCLVVARAMLRDKIRDPTLLIRSFALFAMVGQLSPTLAPSLGSLIQHMTNWHINFWFITLLSSATIVMTMLIFKETKNSQDRYDQQRLSRQLSRLLGNRTFLFYSLFSGVVFGFIMNYFTAAPFILQHHYHIPVLYTGLYLLLMPVSLVVGSFYASRLAAQRIASDSLVKHSIRLFVGLSIINFLLTRYIDSLAIILLLTVPLGLLCGRIVPILTAESMNAVTGPIGLASALQAAIKMVSTACCMAIGLLIPAHTLHNLSGLFLLLACLLVVLSAIMTITGKKSACIASAIRPKSSHSC